MITMSYKALYLKYRPQTFEEVAGQTPVVKTLKKALSAGKIAHAYLFSGPRGTGKTTMARLFAKALNCEKGLGMQCCQCEDCKLIAEGAHPDVTEIDAASNNGVDQVRDLIEQVGYSPIRGKYKVYIIDEVHMMSTGAFNALLKTLEEPPEHVVFILCTTEPHKVLPTILSRCQRYEFHPLTEEEMKQKLIEVLHQEKAGFEEAALDGVIELADGGMRDALSITDQLLAYSNNNLYLQDLLDVYGLASKEEKISLLKAVGEGNATLVVGKCDLYRSGGIDLRRLTKDLIRFLKDVLVYRKTNDADLLTQLKKEECEALDTYFPGDKLNTSLTKLMDTQASFSRVDDVRSLLELTLLELTSTKEEIALFSLNKKTQKEEEKPLSKDHVQKETPSLPKKEEKKEEEEKAFDTSHFTYKVVAFEGEEYHLEEDTLIKIIVRANKEERKKLMTKWDKLTDVFGDPNAGQFAQLLHNGSPYILSDECLVITYSFSKDSQKVNIKENQKPLQELIKNLIGKDVFIYALDSTERGNLLSKYYVLMKSNKLPSKEDECDIPKIK